MLLALAGNGCLIPGICNAKQAMSCPMWPLGMEYGPLEEDFTSCSICPSLGGQLAALAFLLLSCWSQG